MKDELLKPYKDLHPISRLVTKAVHGLEAIVYCLAAHFPKSVFDWYLERKKQGERLTLVEIHSICNANSIPIFRIAEYDPSIIAREAMVFFLANCPPQTAKEWLPYFKPSQIAVLHYLKAFNENKKHFKDIFKNPRSFPDIELGDPSVSQIDFLGTGIDGVVIRYGDEQHRAAIKYTRNAVKEFFTLGIIRSEYVVKASIMPKGVASSYWMEYIKGKSLEQLISSGSVPTEKILKYGSHLCQGLVDMRKAGIFYHQDIRPSNILIDEEKDRAVIIDLGIATKDRHYMQMLYAECKAQGKLLIKNRRFGGPNDLVSLGQIMYTMATGKLLFLDEETGEKTLTMTLSQSDYKDIINDYRTKVYLDESGELLEKYLKKVDDNIKNKTKDGERLKLLIKECLTAGNGDYGRINRLFQEKK